jgi:signal transduction histidine kinase
MTGRLAADRAEEAAAPINAVGLYAACYCTLLGSTYLVLPTSELVLRPSFLELRGLAYTVTGLALLWAAIGALRVRHQQTLYLLGGTLVLATATDLLARSAYGSGCAHALFGMALWYTALRPREPSRFSPLGLLLGGWNVCIGTHGLLAPASATAVPLVGAALSGAYLVAGLAVVTVSVGAGYRSRWRPTVHLAAGVLGFGHLATLLWSNPLVTLTVAASWFRVGVLAFLPGWERRVARANARTIRARTGVAFGTVALVAGMTPLALIAWHGEESARFPGLGAWPHAAFWAVLAIAALGVWLGTQLVGPSMARALRTALDPSERQPGSPVLAVEEFDEVRHVATSHARRISDLESALAQRDDHAGGIGHDLRSPLSAISNAGTLLQRGPLDPAQQRRVGEMILRGVGQMRSLVDNLVQTARLSSGTAEPIAPRDLAVPALLEDLRAQFEAHADGARVRIEPPPDATIRFDRAALARILTNLVENALKFSPADASVVVRAEQAEERIRIRVIDRGPGVPANERGRIFDRFYRAGGAHRVEGFGLGLYICQQLAEAGGARLAVTDSPGGGATFVLDLPAAETRRRAVG